MSKIIISRGSGPSCFDKHTGEIMNNMKNKLATALAAALTAQATLPSDAQAKGRADLFLNNQGILADVIGAGRTIGEFYTGALGRARVNHSWTGQSDNVFALAELNAGYNNLQLASQARFSQESNYGAVPFVVVQLQGKTPTANGSSMQGSVWLGSSLPNPAVLEARIAGSADLNSNNPITPDSIEVETLTWKTQDGFSGTVRPFVAYDLADNLQIGAYTEINWSQEQIAAPVGLKISYK